MPEPVKLPEGFERVLLVGGTFHFRVAIIKSHLYEVHIAKPTDLAHPIDSAMGYTGEIINVDMPTERYVRSSEFHVHGMSLGWFFIYDELLTQPVRFNDYGDAFLQHETGGTNSRYIPPEARPPDSERGTPSGRRPRF